MPTTPRKRIVSAVGTIVIPARRKNAKLAEVLEGEIASALNAAFKAGMSTHDVEAINKIRQDVRDRVRSAYGS